jgi:malate synthase
MKARAARQALLDTGKASFAFLPETRSIREAEWTIAPIPADLKDRRVEITGPVERKMVINAMNSGASTFMADFEDSSTPTWENMVRGQINLRQAVDRTTGFKSPDGKCYQLDAKTATLIVRPRGWHMLERHMLVDGDPVSASLFDFGIFFFHNAERLVAQGSGPYFYLPKIESHLEARLWDHVFNEAESRMHLPRGTIKATVLIETLPAAFEMDEILYALRANIVGLNCGRWDYIFSYIKRLGRTPDRLTPDRSAMTMDRAFLAAYSLRLIATCHRRGAYAMGGMSAFIPVKNDESANRAALEKVRADKLREVTNGHDGTWVAHPALVPVALEAFAAMEGPNQLAKIPDRIPGREEMLELHTGERTEDGARENIRVGVQYLAAWLGGKGAVPLYNLMEDAATAEICRSQLWQWLCFEAPLSNGQTFSRDLFDSLFDEEVGLLAEVPRIAEAARLFHDLVTAGEFEEFLTLPAYPLLA